MQLFYKKVKTHYKSISYIPNFSLYLLNFSYLLTLQNPYKIWQKYFQHRKHTLSALPKTLSPKIFSKNIYRYFRA